MKIKLKPLGGAPPPEQAADSAPQASTPSAAPKLALKIKKNNPSSSEVADGAPADAPKQKRKYTKKPKDDSQPSSTKTKKRPLEDGEEGAPAKRKSKPTLKSLAANQQSDDDDDDDDDAPPPPPRPRALARNQSVSVKLSLKPKGPAGMSRQGNTPIIKVKAVGKAPPRPPGVGYDSEADEAEGDPAIEAQFVLRMPAGRDCDLLRKAIEDKTIGKSQSQGGPGVHFRFFDREGRRTMITIQGRLYAATMVELPCVIESLKSWNKKDWVKTADVCQMLLVLGEVKNEEEAKKYPRPAEVEPDSYRFPHGLTPPMHRVRKRRFRPRKSFMDVERIETNTESLLTEDANAMQTKFELVDTDESEDDAEGSSDDAEEEEDVDAQGEDEEMMDAQNFEEEALDAVDEDDIMQAFMDQTGMDADNVQIEYQNGADNDDLFGDGGDGDQGAVLEIEGVEMPVTARDVAKHALQNPNVVIETESAASTPAAATSNDDADDDDDDDEEEEEEEDEEAAQKAQQMEELKEQIQELNKAVQEQEQARERTGNILHKKRIVTRIEGLQRDLDVKQKQLQQLTGGEAED
jgi:transcription initiation factor TFIID subunit 7